LVDSHPIINFWGSFFKKRFAMQLSWQKTSSEIERGIYEFCMEFSPDRVRLQEVLNSLIHIEYEALECIEMVETVANVEICGDKENSDCNPREENIEWRRMNAKQLHEKLKINQHIDRICCISNGFQSLNIEKEKLDLVQAKYNQLLDRYETSIVAFNKILSK
jgi:hypothetical protein